MDQIFVCPFLCGLWEWMVSRAHFRLCLVLSIQQSRCFLPWAFYKSLKQINTSPYPFTSLGIKYSQSVIKAKACFLLLNSSSSSEWQIHTDTSAGWYIPVLENRTCNAAWRPPRPLSPTGTLPLCASHSWCKGPACRQENHHAGALGQAGCAADKVKPDLLSLLCIPFPPPITSIYKGDDL